MKRLVCATLVAALGAAPLWAPRAPQSQAYELPPKPAADHARAWEDYSTAVLKQIAPFDASRYEIHVTPQEPLASITYLSGKIELGPALLDRLDDPRELAVILGHEIGHDILGHGYAFTLSSSTPQETAADAYGAALVPDGACVLKRILEEKLADRKEQERLVRVTALDCRN